MRRFEYLVQWSGPRFVITLWAGTASAATLMAGDIGQRLGIMLLGPLDQE